MAVAEGTDIERVPIGRGCQKQKVPAVGKNPGLSVSDLVPAGIELRDGYRRATTGGNAQQRAWIRREQDCAIRSPRTAGGDRRWKVADDLHRTSVRVDRFQLPVCKEADKAALGRPERERGVF